MNVYTISATPAKLLTTIMNGRNFSSVSNLTLRGDRITTIASGRTTIAKIHIRAGVKELELRVEKVFEKSLITNLRTNLPGLVH